MNNSKETTLLLNAESFEQLNKAKDNEILNILKVRFIMKALKKVRPSKLDLIDGGEQVERALKLIRVADYMHLDNKENDYLLNLQDFGTITLNYSERKAVREQLIRNLEIMFVPISAMAQKIRTELPEIFEVDSKTSLPATNAKILELEAKRRENLEKLIVLRNKKCALLKAAAELKIGPYLGNELELLYANARSNLIKTKVLRDYFINHMCTQTEHSVKAIQEVQGYIAEAVEQIKED